MCAFNFAREFYDAPYEISVASSAGGPVFSCGGLSIETFGPDETRHGDTVIVVGGPEAHLLERQPATISLLRSLAPATQRMASVCTGAFYLAEGGILDWSPRDDALALGAAAAIKGAAVVGIIALGKIH